jgi:hypothetical protein
MKNTLAYYRLVELTLRTKFYSIAPDEKQILGIENVWRNFFINQKKVSASA